jgi:hypothetical protein
MIEDEGNDVPPLGGNGANEEEERERLNFRELCRRLAESFATGCLGMKFQADIESFRTYRSCYASKPYGKILCEWGLPRHLTEWICEEELDGRLRDTLLSVLAGVEAAAPFLLMIRNDWMHLCRESGELLCRQFVRIIEAWKELPEHFFTLLQSVWSVTVIA